MRLFALTYITKVKVTGTQSHSLGLTNDQLSENYNLRKLATP